MEKKEILTMSIDELFGESSDIIVKEVPQNKEDNTKEENKNE